MRNVCFFLSLVLVLSACEKADVVPSSDVLISGTYVDDEHFCNNHAEAEAGQAYNISGETWLWGGHREEQSFNITGWTLDITELQSGVGRETFEALVEPSYLNPSEYPVSISPNSQVFWLKDEGEHKVFPLEIMTAHEIVNEYTQDGTPIMVAYCPLADLKIIYERTYCETELIFAPSGYTYSQEGTWEDKPGFVLWDRNTESLWWPLINRGVSHTFRNRNMKSLDETLWEISTYAEVLNEVGASVKILAPYQTFDSSHSSIEDMATEVDCE